MDMSWVKDGVRYTLKVVEHPDWTALSESSTPGVLRALLRGTGNKIVGHAGLRSATGVVAGVAAVSATVGGGLVYAGMKLKSHLDDRKAEHDEAPAGAAEQTAASANVVEVEETAVTETRRLRAV
ncbi:hypothetical protein GTY75_08945 [Streptomyces sp. SID8381]|uniref:hypothetical protein n=1 Tax=unclassified Streptomyces TaxID=2593676 RepID=UPI00037EF3DC|nr:MULTISPECIES: hypothetical protein [unclassified Streptomyces]MYX26793.1 hypothetical protein [Streptomyces sp. SID8381]